MIIASKRDRWDRVALLGSVVLLLLIFAADLSTPLGYSVWALYLLPLGMALFQRAPRLPFYLAGVVTLMTAIGFYGSTEGMDPGMSAVNRSIGMAAAWVLAFVVWQVIVSRRHLDRLLWLQESESAVLQEVQGEYTPQQLAGRATAALCGLVGAPTAVMYRLDGEVLLRKGGHAYEPQATPERITVPDGLLGQTAHDGRARVLHEVPADHLPLVSALGRSQPATLVVAPLSADKIIDGVVELGFAERPADIDLVLSLLERLAEPLGVALRSAVYRRRLQELLEETQRQSEAMQAQQEELRVSNEELEEQSRVLRESQARLETQQVELEQTNVQLEEQTQALERQKRDLLQAQGELERNATQLEAASRYKSEFLANMSHELRTPLNSSLILAKLLADNREATLTPEQVKYAEAIHASNNDLLTLINDILDLSKIEAGHMALDPQTVPMAEVVERMQATFEPLARQKQLAFRIDAEGAPGELFTDSQRLRQILKNLLANAFKFTERGEVRLAIRRVGGQRVRFEVHDTGVGIPKAQQAVIFEAFRQADGSTSRRYGGTGLGLSISRELAARLGGDITVDSEPGRGSCFTLELPVTLSAEAVAAAAQEMEPVPVSAPMPLSAERRARPRPHAAADAAAAAPAVPDDRAALRRSGRLILAVEDDVRFAAVLVDLAHDLGFDCVVAPSGTEALRLAHELRPSGILLDVGLPDQSGLSVLERLKRDPSLRHIPVHMISVHDRAQTALELGAVGYMLKPAAREELVTAIDRLQQRLQQTVRRVLLVEDDEELRRNLGLLLGSADIEIVGTGSVAGALEQLAASTFDCMVMDLSLPDGSGYDLLEHMAAGEKYSFPPVIVYTGRVLSRDEEQRLRRYSKTIIIKGARSPERLLDEVTLFLHSVEANLPSEQQRLLRQARNRDAVLDGRRILLVEDDVRNIFALSSVFEPLGVKLDIARNGREALERLEAQPDVDLVLMDIMMPEMDGITATQHIRERPQWASVPIIALTAKAMSDDRERCLEAGANDYVAKPIDIDKLVSLCRVWMPK